MSTWDYRPFPSPLIPKARTSITELYLKWPEWKWNIPADLLKVSLGVRLDLSPACRGDNHGTSLSGWHSEASREHPGPAGAGRTNPSELFSSSGRRYTMSRPQPPLPAHRCRGHHRCNPAQGGYRRLGGAGGHRGRLVRGPFAPPQPAAQGRFHPRPPVGSPCAPRGSAPRWDFPAAWSWARGTPAPTPPPPKKNPQPPKKALQESRLPRQERYQNSAIPAPQLIFAGGSVFVFSGMYMDFKSKVIFKPVFSQADT